MINLMVVGSNHPSMTLTTVHACLLLLFRLHPKRVFSTVRNINQTVRQRSMGPSPMNIPGSNQTSCVNSRRSSCLSTPRSSMYGGDGVEMDNRTNSMLVETKSNQDG